jgi:hypothetical protein
MSTLALRRLVWGTLAIATVAFWTLALIGAATLLTAPACLSVWHGATTPLAVSR